MRSKKQPTWLTPMLATLTHEHFSSPDWVYEPKWDGERCLAFVGKGGVRLLSRNKKPLNASYPELVEALAKIKGRSFIVDGEIVAFDRGRTSFAKLQKRLGIKDPQKARRTGIKVYLYLFDILWLAVADTRKLPLLERKKILRGAVPFKDPIRYTSHRAKEGKKYLAEMCAKGEEGVIAKRATSIYQAGRSTDWLKFKCSQSQEFVIAGWTDPQGSRIGFGALLLGYYEHGEFRYAGKVGTGFDVKTSRSLTKKFRGLKQSNPPFGEPIKERGAHWIKPKLVGQIAFTEWTSDGKLRHGRFLGLRRDKKPGEVVREK